MAKPKRTRGRVAKKISPLTSARIEVELLALIAELKAEFPGLTPAKLRPSRGVCAGRWGSSDDRRPRRPHPEDDRRTGNFLDVGKTLPSKEPFVARRWPHSKVRDWLMSC